MNKKIWSVLVIAGLLLTGCSKQADDSASTGNNKATERTAQKTSSSKANKSEASASSKKDSTASSSTDKEPVKPQQKRYWDDSKALKLQQFMTHFSEEMEQQYKEYTPDNSVDQYGLKLPSEVLGQNAKEHIAVDDVPVDVEWSADGQAGSGVYGLVAVYADSETQQYMQKHVYFFTIIDGTPKVLITMQNQGMDDHRLHFNETANQELKQKFAQIVNE